jgi:predicted Zn-ribbon and HTH transcriptional regulator
MESTTREKIIEILKTAGRPLTAEEIAGFLGGDITALATYTNIFLISQSLLELGVMEEKYL